MDKLLLYHELAELWPLLSPPEDYHAEMQVVRDLLTDHLSWPADRRAGLLELGCGGGHSLVHLTDLFDAVGVDISPDMLRCSRRLNPQAHHVCGDMRDLRLSRTFDVVLIHDAIDYMTSRGDLLAALRTAAAHLDPGGLLIVAPTYVAEHFTDHATASDTNEQDDLEVAYVSHVHDPDPTDETFELQMTLMVRRAGELSIHEDRHICGLFARQVWLDLIEQAGFSLLDQVQIDWEGGEACRFVAVKV